MGQRLEKAGRDARHRRAPPLRLDDVAIVKLRFALQLDDGKGGAVIRGGEGMGCLPEQRPVSRFGTWLGRGGGQAGGGVFWLRGRPARTSRKGATDVETR